MNIKNTQSDITPVRSDNDVTLPEINLASSDCPTVPELNLFATGDLPGIDFEKLARHIESCNICLNKLESSLFDNEKDEFLKHIKPIDENFISELQTPSKILQKALALSGRGDPAHHIEKYRPLFAKPSFEGDLGTFGKFRIIAEIGYGGMGMVFGAYDTLADRRIALKTLRPDLLGNQTLRGLFLDEARMAACLEHPSIIKVLEVDEILGVPYFTMPLIKGESLDQFLSLQTSPISRKLFDHLARQLLEALVYLHEKKIVHRDIKPSNILLKPSGEGYQVVLLDLGLARFVTEAGKSQLGLGTPEFAAPEQICGRIVTESVDIFSLGKVFKHLLADPSNGLIFTGTKGLKNLMDPLPGLLKSMTAEDVLQRPSAVQALNRLFKNRSPRVAIITAVIFIAASISVFLSISTFKATNGKAQISPEMVRVDSPKIQTAIPAELQTIRAANFFQGKKDLASALAANEFSFVSQISSREVEVAYQDKALATERLKLDFDLYKLALNFEGKYLAVLGTKGELQIFRIPEAKSILKIQLKQNAPKDMFWGGTSSNILVFIQDEKVQFLSPGKDMAYDGKLKDLIFLKSKNNVSSKIALGAPLEQSDWVAISLEQGQNLVGNLSTGDIKSFASFVGFSQGFSQKPICLVWRSEEAFSVVYGKTIFTQSSKKTKEFEFFEMPEIATEIQWLSGNAYLFLWDKFLALKTLDLLKEGSNKKICSFEMEGEMAKKIQKLSDKDKFAVYCVSGKVLVFKVENLDEVPSQSPNK